MDREKRNPKEAADSLEDALSRALDMDAEVLLGLAPESFASVAPISIADPRIAVYAVYTMALEAHYLREAGCHETAQLRYDQACAVAAGGGGSARVTHDIPCQEDFDELLAEDGFDEQGC